MLSTKPGAEDLFKGCRAYEYMKANPEKEEVKKP